MKKIFRSLALLMALSLLPLYHAATAEVESGIIRVLLTKLNLTNRVEIALDGSYSCNEMYFQRGSHLTVSSESGKMLVYYEGMTFDAGKTLILTRHQDDSGKENGLRFNGAYELHPGDLHLILSGNNLKPVLYIPVEEYLPGVVPYEMSDSFPLEALKAQAVAARTYALRRIGASGDYDIVDNTNDQVYLGVKAENANAARAVKETQGLCGYYQGTLAECFYSASNGGQTELAEHVWGKGNYGYLSMTDDPYDIENPESVILSASFPKQLTSNQELGKLKDLILDALWEPLTARGYDLESCPITVKTIEKMETVEPLYQNSPSRIMTKLDLTLIVEGQKWVRNDEEEKEISIFSVPDETAAPTEAAKSLTAARDTVTVSLPLFPTVEKALNLSINGSNNELMTVRESENAFILESRRYGHGVGMSQRGAQWMAGKYNWTYEQILRFYYPGMQLKQIKYTYSLSAPVSASFLATPGPAATPTPRPTAYPVLATPGPGEYTVHVTNIGETSYLNLRTQPNTQSTVAEQLYYGQKLIVTKELGDWLEVKTDQSSGYVMAEFVVKDE